MSAVTVSRKETAAALATETGRRPAARPWLRALEMTAPIAKHPHRTLPAVIQEAAGKFAHAPALLSRRECFSYSSLAGRVNRYSRWALEQGIAKGDPVCVMMPNRPDYMAIWLGITQVGGVAALVNTNLTGSSLAHSVNTVAPKHVIVAAEFVDLITEALPRLERTARIWVHGAGRDGFVRLDSEIEQYADGIRIEDLALYLYTSGTTGMPKAARVSHGRLMQWSHWFAGMLETRPGDRLYNCLPMYHSAGGVLATGAVLIAGGSVVIRDHFSAAEFWDDVVRWDCTIFQYIGELCRYLLRVPHHPLESHHRIRICCGNGLRPDVWRAFQSRFRIPRILEFYAATEGNVSLFNVEGKPGAIGRIPPYLAHRFPAALVRCDPESGEPVRDERGFCVACLPGEAGEMIGKMGTSVSNIAGRFEGYTDAQATERKILRDVFEPCDEWYRTGDLMRRDEHGYYYFVDRAGDTFRWKGENVSTAEVAEAIAGIPGVQDAVVYGVRVPGTEGRAGMAAVVTSGDFDLANFRDNLLTHLPEYAVPVFLRLRNAIDVTATFKHPKDDLQREGFDPSRIADAIYTHDRERGAYIRLDRELFDRVVSGQVRL
jgi:fatty-acyl-CoA synthase